MDVCCFHERQKGKSIIDREDVHDGKKRRKYVIKRKSNPIGEQTVNRQIIYNVQFIIYKTLYYIAYTVFIRV